MSAAPEFLHPERALLASLGLPQKKVRELRGSALLRGLDWQHLRNEVLYSATGRAKLLAALHVDLPAVPTAPTPPPPDLQQARAGLVRVLADYSAPKKSPNRFPPRRPPPPRPGDPNSSCLRTYARNRRIILASHAGAEARVRVKDSRKLRPGMSLKCSYIGGDLWELAQRLPRWPGSP
jgi:hypothetical protein